MNRITKEQLASLKKAFWDCRTWEMEDGIFVGNQDGWRIWLGRDKTGVAGGAVNLTLNLQVELTARIAEAWITVANARLKS